MSVGRIFRKGRTSRRASAAEAKGGKPASGAAPRRVGRYELHESIGSGSFGEVWRAVDPQIGRVVAIKILNHPGGGKRQGITEWERRFLREARAAGALSHPGIVTIHDLGLTEDDRPFIVMELVEGRSLEEIARSGPARSEGQALHWGCQVAEALDAAHKRGIVHRDIKPANVLIDKEGRARVADFGIARLSDSDLTSDGRFLGSPAFSSPEQIQGVEVDGRTDLFSLGATLYTVLTGDRPFTGEDLGSLAYAICHVEPAPPRRVAPGLSEGCEAVLLKSMAKDPKARYQTGLEMAEDLRAVAESNPPVHAALARMTETVQEGPKPAPGKATVVKAPARGRSFPRAAVTQTAALILAAAMAAGASVGGYELLKRAAMRPIRLADVVTEPQGASLASWPGYAGAPATVGLRVVHALPDGLLTVWSGKRRLLHARLGHAVAASSEGGSASRLVADEFLLYLPSGEHDLKVQVISETLRIDLTDTSTRRVSGTESNQLTARLMSRPSPRLEIQWIPTRRP